MGNKILIVGLILAILAAIFASGCVESPGIGDTAKKENLKVTLDKVYVCKEPHEGSKCPETNAIVAVLTLSNIGKETLYITDRVILTQVVYIQTADGKAYRNYHIGKECTDTLAPGKRCTVEVFFPPWTPRTNAKLVVEYRGEQFEFNLD